MGVYLNDQAVKRLESDERSMLVGALVAILATFCLGYLAGGRDPATIGGHAIPGHLSCQEDQVVTFDRNADKAPYPLACVNRTEVNP
jgi:hypothetical protein